MSSSLGNLSIQEYTDRFTELSRFAPSIVPTEAEKVKRYIKKMDPRVRTHVLCSRVVTFQGASEMALSIHASIKEEEASKVVVVRKLATSYASVPAKKPKFEPSARGGFQNRSAKPNYDSSKCRRCDKPYHPGKNCDGSKIVCFYYKEGHKTFECHNNPRAASVVVPSGHSSSSAPPKNRVYCMTQLDADAQPDVITSTCLVNFVPA